MNRKWILAILVCCFLTGSPVTASGENKDGPGIQVGYAAYSIDWSETKDPHYAHGGSITLDYQWVLNENLSISFQPFTFAAEFEYLGKSKQGKEIAASSHPIYPAVQLRIWGPWQFIRDGSYFGMHFGRYRQVIASEIKEERECKSDWSPGYGFELGFDNVIIHSIRFDRFHPEYENVRCRSDADVIVMKISFFSYRW